MKRIYFFLTTLLLSLSSISFAQVRERGVWTDVSLSAGDLMLDSYSNKLSAGYTMDYAADILAGYRINKYLAVGAGATVSGILKTGTCSIPVIARFRYDILDKLVSPYIAIDFGYSFAAMKSKLIHPDYEISPLDEELTVHNLLFRKGLCGSISIGASFKNDNVGRLYLGITVGMNEIARYKTGVILPGQEHIENDADKVRGYGRMTMNSQFTPDIRFKIGFEL